MYCVLANLKPRQRNHRTNHYVRTFIRNTPREADVVRLYFGLGDQHPMTLEEIGETFDLTRERVRQIKEKQLED
jgi:DNA-directed RNA polymerase sigma subunit (sigma70/sigma32)